MFQPRGHLAVDVNENNVAMLVDNVTVKFITLMRNITIRYHVFRVENRRSLQ